jgi:nucleotide-binding universal stress UspA family protein
MITRLLVPLDGSRLAESVLPAVAWLAATLRSSVVLIHVIERGASATVHGEAHLTTPAQAEAYLEELARRAFPAETAVERHVHAAEVDNVPASIAAHVGELGGDLIVMCAHGRSGARDLLLGTNAQRVIALGRTPVLLFRAAAAERIREFTGRQWLVPLDAEPEHERGLAAIRPLAQACKATLNLLTVVPTFGALSGAQAPGSRMLPGTTARLLEMSVEDARERLQAIGEQLEREGFAVTVTVLRGDPAGVIAEAAEALEIDLIALATHGKPQLGGFWEGSITPKLCRRCSTPLLLVPVRD